MVSGSNIFIFIVIFIVKAFPTRGVKKMRPLLVWLALGFIFIVQTYRQRPPYSNSDVGKQVTIKSSNDRLKVKASRSKVKG